MKPQYEPTNTSEALGYLVEECGEVLAAVGKSQRWGLGNYNPELPEGPDGEKNGEWLLRELKDLEGAVRRTREFMFRDGWREK